MFLHFVKVTMKSLFSSYGLQTSASTYFVYLDRCPHHTEPCSVYRILHYINCVQTHLQTVRFRRSVRIIQFAKRSRSRIVRSVELPVAVNRIMYGSLSQSDSAPRSFVRSVEFSVAVNWIIECTVLRPSFSFSNINITTLTKHSGMGGCSRLLDV